VGDAAAPPVPAGAFDAVASNFGANFAPGWLADRLTEAGAAAVDIEPVEIAFTAASPDARLAEQGAHHPAWRAARRALGPGAWRQVRAKSLAALADGNEEPGGFRTTSRYLVVTARRR
jgi:hypothetical protein